MINVLGGIRYSLSLLSISSKIMTSADLSVGLRIASVAVLALTTDWIWIKSSHKLFFWFEGFAPYGWFYSNHLLHWEDLAWIHLVSYTDSLWSLANNRFPKCVATDAQHSVGMEMPGYHITLYWILIVISGPLATQAFKTNNHFCYCVVVSWIPKLGVM